MNGTTDGMRSTTVQCHVKGCFKTSVLTIISIEFQDSRFVINLRLIPSRTIMFVALLICVLAVSTNAFRNVYPKGRNVAFDDEVDERMVFTDYIKSGQIDEARKLSLVTDITPNVTSYAGFFNVNETCDSNLFVFFFPSENDPINDPVTLWLEGGPGATLFYSLLTEMGPYTLTVDNELKLREFSWSRNSSMIYVDSPVGTGYSYTGRDDCYATDQAKVSSDLLNALDQFFVVFPEFKKNKFYIAGESYGGKYVPALGYAIHTTKSEINLQGLMIGDGWTDPVNQLLYSESTYQLGLVDDNTRRRMAQHEEKARQFIAQELYSNATDEWTMVYETIFGEASGFGAFYNILYPMGAPEGDVNAWVVKSEVRKAIHVGNASWHGSIYPVYDYLYADISRSVRPQLEFLMEYYPVLLYNGQLDIIVAYPLTMGYVQKLKWSGADDYKVAERKIWRVNSAIAGYVKSAGNFTEVLVRNAGHLVPEDQPEWAFDMYNKFITHRPIAD